MRELLLANGGVTIVDDEDYDFLSKFRWHKTNEGYVRRNWRMSGNKFGHYYLHNHIMNAPEGASVHHKDKNPLNNTKSNLIVVSKKEHRKYHQMMSSICDICGDHFLTCDFSILQRHDKKRFLLCKKCVDKFGLVAIRVVKGEGK